MKFVYVMDEQSRDMLLEHGLELLKEYPGKKLWVFRNCDKATFCLSTELIPHVLSDTLSF